MEKQPLKPIMDLGTQQEYLNYVYSYSDRAVSCMTNGLIQEALVNYGSALESLLRMRYGRGRHTLNDMIVKGFDIDPYFSGVGFNHLGTQKCATCFIDKVRSFRNVVHPDCWFELSVEDANDASTVVMLLYHMMVHCETRLGDFQLQPESFLMHNERSGIKMTKEELKEFLEKE